tara:strand:+ start:337 stop:555 length:219 start_codon:yes stop_codon:yes gene_type:complete
MLGHYLVLVLVILHLRYYLVVDLLEEYFLLLLDYLILCFHLRQHHLIHHLNLLQLVFLEMHLNLLLHLQQKL